MFSSVIWVEGREGDAEGREGDAGREGRERAIDRPAKKNFFLQIFFCTPSAAEEMEAMTSSFVLKTNAIVDEYADILHDVIAFHDIKKGVSSVTHIDEVNMSLYKQGNAYVKFHMINDRLVCVTFSPNHSRASEIHWFNYDRDKNEYRMGMRTFDKYSPCPSHISFMEGFRLSESDMSICCSSITDFAYCSPAAHGVDM